MQIIKCPTLDCCYFLSFMDNKSHFVSSSCSFTNSRTLLTPQYHFHYFHTIVIIKRHSPNGALSLSLSLYERMGHKVKKCYGKLLLLKKRKTKYWSLRSIIFSIASDHPPIFFLSFLTNKPYQHHCWQLHLVRYAM